MWLDKSLCIADFILRSISCFTVGEFTPSVSTINWTSFTGSPESDPKEAVKTISAGFWSPAEDIVLFVNCILGNSGWAAGSSPKYTKYLTPATIAGTRGLA